MKITKKMIADVKKSNKKQLHPQAWHDFQSKPEVEAINYALRMQSGGDIKIEAEKYLAVIHNN